MLRDKELLRKIYYNSCHTKNNSVFLPLIVLVLIAYNISVANATLLEMIFPLILYGGLTLFLGLRYRKSYNEIEQRASRGKKE